MRAAIIACMMLAGCATASAPAPTPVRTVCLPMVTYTAAQQSADAAAMRALPPGNPLAQFMTDYGAMRAADRACLTANPPT